MSAQLVPGEVSRFVARYFGARGRTWLAGLPGLADRAATVWDLEVEHPLSGGLQSCVLAARTRSDDPVVLKIAGPWAPASLEAAALEHWGGGPAPRLLALDKTLGALLLERIRPGDQAASQPFGQIARLIASLHATPPTGTQTALLPSLAEVIEDRFQTAGAEAAARSAAEAATLAPAIEHARTAADELLGQFAGPAVLLHGDLERRNILDCQRRELVAIDPSPCIGDPAYDAAYWATEGQQRDGLEQRCNGLAEQLRLDARRIQGWAAVIAPAQ